MGWQNVIKKIYVIEGEMMRWLLLFLLAVNAVIFIVQIKGVSGEGQEVQYLELPGAKDIRLLREFNVGDVARERCVVIGEVRDQAALDVLAIFLNNRNIKHNVIEKEKELAPSYWVFAQEVSGGAVVKELNEKGIEGYRVGQGEHAGKVSLGLFANIDLAQDLIKKLKKSKIEAVYVEKKKYSKAKWVSFKLDEALRSGALLSDLRHLEINIGEIKEFFCKSIASEK